MTPELRRELTRLLHAALASVAPDIAAPEIILDRPKQASHGDLACNVALQLAKALKQNPRVIAERIVRELPAVRHGRARRSGGRRVHQFLFQRRDQAVCRGTHSVRNRPLRPFGHRRRQKGAGGIRIRQPDRPAARRSRPRRSLRLGAVQPARRAGFEVTREFYVNDAGRQMDILAVSVWLRYLEAQGTAVRFPADGYRGDYVRDIGAQLLTQQGARLNRDVNGPARCVGGGRHG
jgi:arginyl-tRNA synthetase